MDNQKSEKHTKLAQGKKRKRGQESKPYTAFPRFQELDKWQQQLLLPWPLLPSLPLVSHFLPPSKPPQLAAPPCLTFHLVFLLLPSHLLSNLLVPLSVLLLAFVFPCYNLSLVTFFFGYNINVIDGD